MSTLLAGGVLICFSGALALLLQRRIEELFPLSIFGIIAVLYISGLLGNLQAGFIAVLVLAAATLAVLAVKAWQNRPAVHSLVLTPGLLVFCAFLALVWFGHRGRMFSEWDEFSHWGLVIKNMYSLDRLGNVAQATTTFRGYPPAASLFAYFWCKLSGTFQESDTFRSAGLFLFALLLPWLRSLQWKNVGRILAVTASVLLLPCMFNAAALTTIYVDTLLGIILAYVLFVAFAEERRPSDLLLLCAACFVLPLVKASGTGLALIAVLVLTVEIMLLQKDWPGRKKLVWGCLPFAAVLAGKYSWDLYLRLTDTQEAWSTSNLTLKNVWGLLTGRGEEYQKSTIRNFAHAVLDPAQYAFGDTLRFSAVGWGVLFLACGAVVLALLRRERRAQKRYALCLLGVATGYAVYALSLLLLYLFTFTAYEAERLASFDRYLSTYLTAMFAFLGGLLVDRFSQSGRVPGGVCYVVLAFLLLAVDRSGLRALTVSQQQSAAASIELRRQREVPQQVLDKLDAQTDRVYILCQQDNGFDYTIHCYAFTPVKSATRAWSLGPPYDEGDVWTQNLSVEAFAQALQEDTHLYIYHADAQFVEGYGALFADPQAIRDKTLFRVETQGGSVRLVEE